MVLNLEGKAEYINLGDWISYFTYGVFEHDFELKTFEQGTKKITP
jgi:UDP-2,3-diacylglucosamine hydrolase